MTRTHHRSRARRSRSVMDVSGNAYDNGANIHQWDWWQGDNQRWTLTPVE